MAKKAKSTLITVGEGVYIVKKCGSDNYSYYFRFAGIAFRKSTKTNDRNKAAQIALNAYHDALDKKRSGKLVEKTSFKKLAAKYLESIKGQGKYKYHSDQVLRYLMKFFGKMDDISKINQGTLNDYMIWRRQQSEVVNQTLNRENVVLNQMLRFGADYGWNSRDLRIKFQSQKESHRRRAHFTFKEYAMLRKMSQKRIDAFKKLDLSAKNKALLTNQHWAVCLLHDIILIIANTGIRVDELSTVKWKNINWEDTSITLEYAGKTRSTRKIFVRRSGMDALKRIKDRRLAYLEKHALGSLKDDERIQSLPTGRFIKSMKKYFDTLLKDCRFKYKSAKDKHTLTSLRHSYATFGLTRKHTDKVTMRMLAKQMGTSEKMIERHYGHDSTSDYKDELLK